MRTNLLPQSLGGCRRLRLLAPLSYVRSRNDTVHSRLDLEQLWNGWQTRPCDPSGLHTSFSPIFQHTKTGGSCLQMRNLHSRLNLARTVLKELSRQSLGRTQLEKRTVRKLGTHATFEGIFRFLVQTGYVQKSEQRHRAPYVITEKGLKLLEGLQ